MVKQKSNLKLDRISGKNQIFLDGEEIGKIQKQGKLKYSFIKYNMGLSSEEHRKIADMMDTK